MNFHVRTHWSKENDWTGHHEADTPEEALAKARCALAQRVGVTEEYLNSHAHFTVRYFDLSFVGKRRHYEM